MQLYIYVQSGLKFQRQRFKALLEAYSQFSWMHRECDENGAKFNLTCSLLIKAIDKLSRPSSMQNA